MSYLFSILTTAAIFALLALSLNLITGYAGQAMMGIAAFFGIGAYTAAIVVTKWGGTVMSNAAATVIGFILAMVIAAVFGMFIGFISLRLQADFLAITTIGVNFVMEALFKNMEITGASLGIDIRETTEGGRTAFFGLSIYWYFVIVLAAIVIVCLLIKKMERSRFGMALASMGNDSAAAESMGIDVKKYRILTFTLGCAFAGLAGAFYTNRMGYISAGDFAFVISIQVVSMCVIGGLGTIRGPIFGALLVKSLPEILRFAQNYSTLMYAVLLVVTVRFLPQGILGEGSPIWEFLVRMWRKVSPRKKTRADLIAEEAQKKGGEQ